MEILRVDAIVLLQISDIKTNIVHLLTYQKATMTIQEKAVVEQLYYNLDLFLCDKISHKRFTTEELLDNILMENSLVLKKTKNTSVKKLVHLLDGGIQW